MALVALAGNVIRFWNSKNVCMRNFYLWVAVIGLLLTIQGSWKLVQQYAKSPTVTNMKILRNKTIEFLPNATLCLPIRINGNQPPLVFNFSLNSSSFADRLHEEGNWSRRHVLDVGWDLPTLKYFHAVVAIVSEIDRGNPLSSDVRSEKAKILISDTKQILSELKAIGVLHEDLIRKVGREYQRRLDLRVRMINYTAFFEGDFDKIYVLEDLMMSWITPFEVCYKVALTPWPLEEIGTFLQVDVDLNPQLLEIAIEDTTAFAPFVALDLNGRVTCELMGDTAQDNVHTAVVFAKRGNGTYAAMQLNSVLKMMPVVSGKVQCNRELFSSGDNTMCRILCIGEEINRRCPEGPLWCVEQLDNITKQCKAICFDTVDACDHYHYAVETVEVGHSPHNPDTKHNYKTLAQIQLRIGTFFYPQFEEDEAKTIDELIADLGGNISLWLGASFVGLFFSLANFGRVIARWSQSAYQPVSTTALPLSVPSSLTTSTLDRRSAQDPELGDPYTPPLSTNHLTRSIV